MKIQIKRIYDDPARGDGFRVLVDRLWPRGVTKERAALDRWDKGVAPSHVLRKQFNHDPELMAEFKKSYLKELEENTGAVGELLDAHRKSRKKTLTLLYGARDPACNHAMVLAEALNTFDAS